MSKEPVQRYIIKRVDGFVSVCDTQDNEAPIDNSAIGLEALLNGLNTAVRLARFERIHDLNQMGGLCEENARLKADLEKSDAVVFTQAVENERLKAEVERLTRKLEVADNHAQCLEMVINAGTAKELRLKAEVERLEEGNDCLDKMHEKEMERSAYLCEEVNRTTAWGRGLESDLSHARVEISFLKAEVERLKEGNDCLDKMHDKEMERSAYLCEQVERLEKGIQPEGSNDAVGRAVELLLEKEKEIASLKAEVERLTNLKSGADYFKAEEGKQS